jgi:predicted glycosyltransferase
MKRLLVYSHDTYGLGNIRRMLAICQYLLETTPDLSILLITGSPVIHSLRLPTALDYIKLPCLHRVGRGEYTTRYLSASLDEAIQLRSDLILATVINFVPDLFLVDKKPLGVKGELAATLEYLHRSRPEAALALVLRDILDHPDAITSNWERNGHYAAIENYYDEVLVVGEQRIFDPIREYRFPRAVAGKTHFCGYIRREAGPGSREELRRRLQIREDERLILVTPGGGQDGDAVIENYLLGLRDAPFGDEVKSLIVCGPEMPAPERVRLEAQAVADPRVIFYDFTGEMIEFIAAADVVVAMGGYNTVCEILSQAKPAVIIPRVRPTEEQWLRADLLSGRGFFQTIHPDELTPEHLIKGVAECLTIERSGIPEIDLNGLPVVAAHVAALIARQNDRHLVERSNGDAHD